jgi:hypothetical protein
MPQFGTESMMTRLIAQRKILEMFCVATRFFGLWSDQEGPMLNGSQCPHIWLPSEFSAWHFSNDLEQEILLVAVTA